MIWFVFLSLLQRIKTSKTVSFLMVMMFQFQVDRFKRQKERGMEMERHAEKSVIVVDWGKFFFLSPRLHSSRIILWTTIRKKRGEAHHIDIIENNMGLQLLLFDSSSKLLASTHTYTEADTKIFLSSSRTEYITMHQPKTTTSRSTSSNNAERKKNAIYIWFVILSDNNNSEKIIIKNKEKKLYNRQDINEGSEKRGGSFV